MIKRLSIQLIRWFDDRLGLSALLGPSMMHLVPRDAGWWYVFGSATTLAFIVQVVTGVALSFSFVSSSSQAYETLLFISDHAPFGRFLRGLHYFGAWRDFVFGAGLILVITLLALLVGPPPIEKPPGPSILEAYPKPDWYLLWYFALLALIPAWAEGYLMILGPAVIGILLLIVPLLSNKGERAPSRRPGSIAVVLLSVIMIGSLWIAGVKSPWTQRRLVFRLLEGKLAADERKVLGEDLPKAAPSRRIVRPGARGSGSKRPPAARGPPRRPRRGSARQSS